MLVIITVQDTTYYFYSYKMIQWHRQHKFSLKFLLFNVQLSFLLKGPAFYFFFLLLQATRPFTCRAYNTKSCDGKQAYYFQKKDQHQQYKCTETTLCQENDDKISRIFFYLRIFKDLRVFVQSWRVKGHKITFPEIHCMANLKFQLKILLDHPYIHGCRAQAQ